MKSVSGSDRFRRVAAFAALAVALSGCSPALADPSPESGEDPCAEYGRADAEMNAAYRQILHLYKDEVGFLPSFQKAQGAWLAYRDAHLDSLYPGPAAEYGSILPTCRCLASTELTEERTKILNMWIEGVDEGDVCGGSIRMK